MLNSRLESNRSSIYGRYLVRTGIIRYLRAQDLKFFGIWLARTLFSVGLQSTVGPRKKVVKDSLLWCKKSIRKKIIPIPWDFYDNQFLSTHKTFI